MGRLWLPVLPLGRLCLLRDSQALLIRLCLLRESQPLLLLEWRPWHAEVRLLLRHQA